MNTPSQYAPAKTDPTCTARRNGTSADLGSYAPEPGSLIALLATLDRHGLRLSFDAAASAAEGEARFSLHDRSGSAVLLGASASEIEDHTSIEDGDCPDCGAGHETWHDVVSETGSVDDLRLCEACGWWEVVS